jgi:hypothetical protein
MCVSTGNRYLDIGLAVGLAVATSGASLGASATTITGAAVQGSTIATQIGVGLGATTVGGASALGGLVLGVGGSVLGSMMTPQQPEFPTYNVPQQTAQVQQFNSQQIATTGSGGRQATASLAEAIQRSKQRKLSQEDVGDLSIDTSAFASTGLQLA